MLVAGPSTRNPDANHRLEFLPVGDAVSASNSTPLMTLPSQ